MMTDLLVYALIVGACVLYVACGRARARLTLTREVDSASVAHALRRGRK